LVLDAKLIQPIKKEIELSENLVFDFEADAKIKNLTQSLTDIFLFKLISIP